MSDPNISPENQTQLDATHEVEMTRSNATAGSRFASEGEGPSNHVEKPAHPTQTNSKEIKKREIKKAKTENISF